MYKDIHFFEKKGSYVTKTNRLQTKKLRAFNLNKSLLIGLLYTGSGNLSLFYLSD